MLVQDRFSKYFNEHSRSEVKDLIANVHCLDMSELNYKDVKPGPLTILIGERQKPDLVMDRMKESGIRHYVDTARRDFLFEILSACMMHKYPKRFMSGEKPFMLFEFQHGQEVLKTDSMIASFLSSKEKPNIMAKVQSFLSTNPVSQRFSDKTLLITDELVSNALYQAPVNKKGERVFKDLNRTQYAEFYLKQKAARYFLFMNRRKLLFGCQDPYGSLDFKSVLDILSAPKDPEYGLGLKLVLENAHALYFGVKKGDSTLVAGSFEMRGSLREMETMGRHLHFFEISE
jgi:hypothetical protein